MPQSLYFGFEYKLLFEKMSKSDARRYLVNLIMSEKISAEEVQKRFSTKISPRLVSLETGGYVDTASNGADAATYDQRKASKDPELSIAADPNNAKVVRVPKVATVYCVLEGDKVDHQLTGSDFALASRAELVHVVRTRNDLGRDLDTTSHKAGRRKAQRTQRPHARIAHRM